MKGTTEITAELSGGSAPQLIFAKQGDAKSRFLRVIFLYGGKSFPLSEVSRTEIRVKKPDGKITVNDGSAEYDKNGAIKSFVYPLSAQSLIAAGEGAADFILFGKNEEVISTVAAKLIISEAPVGDKAVESLSEYAAFEQRVNSCDSAIKVLQEQTTLLERDLTTMGENYGRWYAALSDQLGGINFRIVTKDEYQALSSPSENTIYFVVDDQVGKFTLYLGAIPLKGSSGAVTAAVKFNAAAGQALSLQEKKTEE